MGPNQQSRVLGAQPVLLTLLLGADGTRPGRDRGGLRRRHRFGTEGVTRPGPAEQGREDEESTDQLCRRSPPGPSGTHVETTPVASPAGERLASVWASAPARSLRLVNQPCLFMVNRA